MGLKIRPFGRQSGVCHLDGQDSRRYGTVADALGQITGTLLFMLLVMLVVGGVYYLIRRPRVTFWGAVFRWWVVLIAVLLVVINVLGRLASA
jgi:hypothetical protein